MPELLFTAAVTAAVTDIVTDIVTVVQNIDLLAGMRKLQALPNFHFLFDGIVLQALDPLFFLHVFPQNLLVFLFKLGYLTSFGKQRGNSVRAFQGNKGVGDSGKHHNRVSSLQSRVSHTNLSSIVTLNESGSHHSMTDKIVVFSTCGSEEEAVRIAKHVVDARIAACVN